MLGAALRLQSLLAADQPDDCGEGYRFDETGVDVLEHERLERQRHVARGTDTQDRRRDEHPAEDSDHVGKDGQTGQSDDQSDQSRRDEQRHRIDAHHGQGVDLLRDLHRAQLGGDRRADAPGDDDRREQRGQAPRDRHGDESGHEIHRAHLAQLIGRLQTQRDADEETDQGHQRERVVAGA